jgi:DNA-binding NtrC family response regulator
MQRVAATMAAAVAAPVAAPLAAVAAAGVPAGVGAIAHGFPSGPEPELEDAAPEPEPADEGGGSLAAVAKAAAMKAERAAIEQTLRQVHWNRRKAAQILGVSYKTLLNKIKECGITR